MARGRPRAFDIDSAVATVLPIFIAKGYEGASFGELIGAIGINPPSFYSAFESKEGLFRRALRLYADRGAPHVSEALSLPTAYQVIERLLRSTADAHTDPAKPPGCLFVQGALSCSDSSYAIRDELAMHRAAFEHELQERLVIALANQDLPIDTDPAALALFISTVCQGMAVQAAGGATRKTLHRLVDITLNAIPKPTTLSNSELSSRKSQTKPPTVRGTAKTTSKRRIY